MPQGHNLRLGKRRQWHLGAQHIPRLRAAHLPRHRSRRRRVLPPSLVAVSGGRASSKGLLWQADHRESKGAFDV